MKAYVYLILNTVNNRAYVGKARDVSKRWKQHLNRLSSKSHTNRELQEDYLIYGEEFFTFQVMAERETEREAFLEERGLATELYDLGINLYNCMWALGVGGYSPSEETRQKLRDKMIGRVVSEETRKKIGDSKRGLIGEKSPRYGKKHTEETKESLRNNPKNKSFLGRKHTEETKQKMRQAGLGRKKTEESIEKTAKANRNRVDGRILYSAFGEEKTLAQWVRDLRCSVTYSTVFDRIQNMGWDTESSISTPGRKQVFYEAFGEVKSLRDWSKDSRCVVCYNTLKNRTATLKWNLEDALGRPKGPTCKS